MWRNNWNNFITYENYPSNNIFLDPILDNFEINIITDINHPNYINKSNDSKDNLNKIFVGHIFDVNNTLHGKFQTNNDINENTNLKDNYIMGIDIDQNIIGKIAMQNSQNLD